MTFVKDDDVIQTFAADRANDALDVGVLPGCRLRPEKDLPLRLNRIVRVTALIGN